MPCHRFFPGGVADFVSDKEDGFLYDYQEVPYLANRITQLFENDELCNSFSEAAKVKAKRAHDRDKNVRDYLAMYREILE